MIQKKKKKTMLVMEKQRIDDNWKKGYLRAISNMKRLTNGYLLRLTKKPLKIMNGNVVITSRDLKLGLDGIVKQHLIKKEKQWKKQKES